MTNPLTIGGDAVDLSLRVKRTATVAASPSGASETVVAVTPAFDAQLPIAAGVLLVCNLAFTVGTSGTACTVILRRGSTTGGTLLYSSGATTGGVTAANLMQMAAVDFDTAPGVAQQYCVTLTVANGSAASTVSSVQLVAVAL